MELNELLAHEVIFMEQRGDESLPGHLSNSTRSSSFKIFSNAKKLIWNRSAQISKYVDGVILIDVDMS